MIKTVTPIDNSILVERNFASNSEVENVLESSLIARKDWSNTSLAERKTLIEKFVDSFLSNQQEVVETLCRQIGRPISQCPGEMRGFEERAKFMINNSDKALENVTSKKDNEFDNFIKKEPLGTIFVIAPWNYPFNTSVNSIVPSLLAGNAVILKHSSQTPLCAEQLFEAAKKANLPNNIFQFLHLDHSTTSKVISDTRINHVLFTGSVSGGREIKKSISTRFINAGLELGGKDPAYVRSDCNINHTIENLVDGSYFNSGQSCCGIERIYVDEKIYDQFIEGFKNTTEKYILGNPLEKETNLGPVVKLKAAKYIRSQVSKAINLGGKNIVNEKIFKMDDGSNCYVGPSALVDVDHSMEFMKEETFGPTVGIMKVSNEKEAIQLMNDSDYGLTASVWTSDTEFAKDMGSKIETGTFFMNRCDYLDPGLAWTGVKDTGIGVTLSVLGFDHLTRAKSYHIRTI